MRLQKCQGTHLRKWRWVWVGSKLFSTNCWKICDCVHRFISCGQYLPKLAKCSQRVCADPSALGLPLDRGDCLGKYIQRAGLFRRELNKYRLCKQAPTCLITWLNKQCATTSKACVPTHKQTHSLWRPPADYEAGRCLSRDLNLTISPGSFHCEGEKDRENTTRYNKILILFTNHLWYSEIKQPDAVFSKRCRSLDVNPDADPPGERNAQLMLDANKKTFHSWAALLVIICCHNPKTIENPWAAGCTCYGHVLARCVCVCVCTSLYFLFWTRYLVHKRLWI